MAEINRQYEEALKNAGAKGFTVSQKTTSNWEEVDEGFREVLEKLIVIDDIIIELCGNWLWISGETKAHKAEIKAAGCYWARKKSMWYWRPASYKCHTRRTRSMEEIREKYGSSLIRKDEKKKISA